VQTLLSRNRIRQSHQPAAEIAAILRQPALSKLFYWVSQAFIGGRIMRTLLEKHHGLLSLKLREAIKCAGLGLLSEDDALNSMDLLGVMVDNAAKALTNTLDCLHSPDFRKTLQEQPANIVNWTADRNLRQVSLHVEHVTRWLKGISAAIETIFVFADEMGVMKKGYEQSGLQVATKYLQQGFKEEALYQ
jgi:hypothetical protein